MDFILLLELVLSFAYLIVHISVFFVYPLRS